VPRAGSWGALGPWLEPAVSGGGPGCATSFVGTIGPPLPGLAGKAILPCLLPLVGPADREEESSARVTAEAAGPDPSTFGVRGGWDPPDVGVPPVPVAVVRGELSATGRVLGEGSGDGALLVVGRGGAGAGPDGETRPGAGPFRRLARAPIGTTSASSAATTASAAACARRFRDPGLTTIG
jgi:hypothetical protein